MDAPPPASRKHRIGADQPAQPKGQQDRRWVKPLAPRPMSKLDRIRAQRQDPYGHLRVASDRAAEYAERRRTGNWAGVNAPRPGEPQQENGRFRTIERPDPRLRELT